MAQAQFQMTPRPLRSRPTGTKQNPTMASLMADQSIPRREVRIPKVTRASRVKYDPIIINGRKFMPGTVHNLPIPIADELDRAIDCFEQAPIDQMTGKSEVSKGLLEELLAQKEFEARRAQPRNTEFVVDGRE